MNQLITQDARQEQEGNRSGADFCRSALPANRGLYYEGGWHDAKSGHQIAVESPGTGESLGEIADGDAADIGAIVDHLQGSRNRVVFPGNDPLSRQRAGQAGRRSAA